MCWGHLVICNDCSDLLSLYQLIKKLKLLTVFWWWGTFVSRAWDWKSNCVLFHFRQFCCNNMLSCIYSDILALKATVACWCSVRVKWAICPIFYSESVNWPGKQLFKNWFSNKSAIWCFNIFPASSKINQLYYWCGLKPSDLGWVNAEFKTTAFSPGMWHNLVNPNPEPSTLG